MANPFGNSPQTGNWSAYLRNLLAPMKVGDTLKVQFDEGRPLDNQRSLIRQASDKLGIKLKTKTDRATGELWVMRIEEENWPIR